MLAVHTVEGTVRWVALQQGTISLVEWMDDRNRHPAGPNPVQPLQCPMGQQVCLPQRRLGRSPFLYRDAGEQTHALLLTAPQLLLGS
ncbi:MAG: hypothetical protein TE42_05740 [Candidatus Synechococcus spongiarum SP3]|uniref:Uncharacterized protein n=1 Tax=Candidatus Synechococcus spongiarum SP3 TaxID=1604020 RepID=A0A0G2HKV7_9SYNE|nr:MAG: hypothetical protein TE42_05740 [Candidatus Synechococcus spongiarum SP3]